MNNTSFFQKQDKIALIGVSANTAKFGYKAFEFLIKNDYKAVPVNPGAAEIAGVACVNDISELPPDVMRAVVLTPQKHTDEVLRQLSEKGIREVWVQQMCQSPRSENLSSERDLNARFGKCLFLHAEPVKGIHAFHRGLLKLFGRYKSQ